VRKASLSLGNAISFYKSKNSRFPDSAEELADFLSRYNPAPYFNPQDFKRLEFNRGEDDSLTVSFEVEADTNGRPGTGSLEYWGDQKKKPNQSSDPTLKTPIE
jgi:hypothetical protein